MRSQSEVRVDGPLSVSSTRYGEEVLVVSLAGELDAANVAIAREALRGAILSHCPLVVIDLDGLESLDSSGIGLLVGLSEALTPETLRIVPSSAPVVMRILAATGIRSLIQMTTERAVQAA